MKRATAPFMGENGKHKGERPRGLDAGGGEALPLAGVPTWKVARFKVPPADFTYGSRHP